MQMDLGPGLACCSACAAHLLVSQAPLLLQQTGSDQGNSGAQLETTLPRRHRLQHQPVSRFCV